MCGIAGIVVNPKHTAIGLKEQLQAMAHAMVHRGPDDGGVWLMPNGQAGLATRRLAIRDLSPAGHMPMTTADGLITITYNGEIYNADELRMALEQAGCRFRSHSDTEVILLGYIVWGVQIVAKLRGMFAFAILDQRPTIAHPDGLLLLARDPLGVKTLYYARTGSHLIFASEIKAILASTLVGREISPAGLYGYLHLGSVPNPWTIYRDIQALEPATYCEIDLRQPRQLVTTCYWQLPLKDSTPGLSREQAVELVRERLLDAVRVRLVSDVPLGAFLSGGLDSSAVVALMRQATSGTLRTCSMVFEEAAYSEAPYARAVAEHVGAEHHERVITADDLLREFDRIIEALDQPSVDGVNTYFVSKSAREAGLTVALSGLGGDELFAGYANTFRQVPHFYRAMRLVQALPMGKQVAQTIIQALPQPAQWRRVADNLAQPVTPASAYLTRRGLFSSKEVRQLLSPEMYAAGQHDLHLADYVRGRTGNSVNGSGKMSTNWVSRTELRTYTHNQLLRDTDVMSMAHSLEVREPLLDVRLIESVLSLPERYLNRASNQPKPLLNDAVGHLLPEIVRQRRDKKGFVFPFDVWMKGRLAQRVCQTLDAVEQTGWLQGGAAHGIFDAYQRGQMHWSRVWALASLATCSAN